MEQREKKKGTIEVRDGIGVQFEGLTDAFVSGISPNSTKVAKQDYAGAYSSDGTVAEALGGPEVLEKIMGTKIQYNPNVTTKAGFHPVENVVELPDGYPSVTNGAAPALDFVANSGLLNTTEEVGKIFNKLGPKRFEQEVRDIAQNLTPEQIEKAKKFNEILAERLRRIVLHPQEVDDTTIDKASTWFAAKFNELRVFHMLPDQHYDSGFGFEGLQNAGPLYDFKKFMPPFNEFAIACDDDWFDLTYERTEATLFRFDGYIVRGSYDTGKWHFYRKHTTRNAKRDLHVYMAALLDQKAGTVEALHDPNFHGVMTAEQHQNIKELTGQTFRFIVNFILILNHRGVKVELCDEGKEPGRPPTRQQRRAAGYKDVLPDGGKRDHYKIYIPAKSTAVKYANEVVAGVNVKERRPHDVRGHLRTDQYGRKRIRVKPHKRCKDSTKPYFLADYDAANLGME